ncbi:MAG: hypothetical protein JWM52_183 [Candidatus Saccharibacteria bacterium]|nr:hypothetical protein [Candidatus Saccharibacteria bacterium]
MGDPCSRPRGDGAGVDTGPGLVGEDVLVSDPADF